MDVSEFLSRDRFAGLLGIELTEASEGKASAKLEIGDQHLNAMDNVQGGAIFSLADLAFAAASNSHGTIAVGINASISFIKAVNKGTLYAEASEVSRNAKIAVYLINITDSEGELIACFQGMVYRKKESWG